MSTAAQHRLLNGVILPQFLDRLGIEATKENVASVKQIFKRYLRVGSTAALDTRSMKLFIEAVLMLAAREWGAELTFDFAEKSMREILTQTTRDYDLQ